MDHGIQPGIALLDGRYQLGELVIHEQDPRLGINQRVADFLW
jgi:hypothetical protein